MGQSAQPLIPAEEQFKMMADIAPVMIWTANTSKDHTFFNKAWLNFTGRNQDDETGFGWAEHVHPDDRSRCLQNYTSSFDSHKEYSIEYRLKRHDGLYRWIIEKAAPRHDSEGAFLGYIGSCTDVDDLIQNRKHNSDYLSSEFIEGQNFSTNQGSGSGPLMPANGFSSSSRAQHASDIELHETRERLTALNHELEIKIANVTHTLTSITPDTQALNEELNAVNENLEVANEELNTINEELSESRENLEKLVDDLASSENKTRNIVENAPFPIGVYVGREMRIEFANQSIINVWGKGNDVIGKLYSQVLPELSNQEIFAQLDNVFTTGVPFHARNQRVDLVVEGRLQPFYFNYSFTALFDTSGNVYGVMNTAAEVTDMVLAKQKVEQGEKNLRSMILQAPVAMCILLGPNHTVEVANELIIELWGKTAADVVGKPIFEGLPDARDQGLEQLLDDVYHKGETFKAFERPVELLRNGRIETVYLDFVYEPYQDSQGNTIGIIAITTDVTEQVKARTELQKTEEMLRFSVEAANAATWYMDAESREIIPSVRFKELFGFHRDTMVDFDDILEIVPKQYHAKINDTISKAKENGETYNLEYPVTLNDGSARWLRTLGRVYPPIGNRRSHFSGLVIDITEYKQDELRKNDFIGMVSHEMKTPLTSLSALVQVLVSKFKNSDDAFVSGALQNANSQVKKMSSLINGFLNVSRLESGKILIIKQNFNLVDLIREIILEVELTVAHKILFNPCDPVIVSADRDKIGSVISNLISNAFKYSPQDKDIELKCHTRDGEAMVSIKDQGLGIKQQDKPKLFDRYYRVENSNTRHIAGFGIGLYLSAEIIQRHQGKIWVESEYGNGSTFYFSLPVA